MSITIKTRTNMNKKFFIYIFFLVPILCASCDWFNESGKKEDREVKAIEVFPDSVRQYLIEQDSLKRGLISKIDTLTTELNTSKKEIEQIQSEIKELKSPGRVIVVLALCSFLLSIVAIILSIIRTNKKVEKQEVKDMTREMVREQVNGLEFRMTRAESNIKEIGKSPSNSKTTSVNSSVDKRLQDLELRLSRIERSNNATPSNISSYDNHSFIETTAAKESEFMRTGYAKVNSSKYFVEIFNSQQEDCVYKIKFSNKEEGEFDIISLGKIKTINDLKEVLDLAPGSCLLNEASTHTVVEKGRCKKIDDNTWEVTRKLVIKVFK